jgi:hypothetical protein
MKTYQWASLTSTDGNLRVRSDLVSHIISDPRHPETSMVHLTTGVCFEVSGDGYSILRQLGES